MGSVKFNLPSLVEMPVYAGATAPVPTGGPKLIWSTVENDMLLWDGMSWNYAGYQDIQNILALSGFNSANYYASASTSPEPGIESGFGAMVLFEVTSIAGGEQQILNCLDPANAVTPGWAFKLLGAKNLVAQVYANNSATSVVTDPYTLAESDVGKLCFALFYYAAGSLQLYTARRLVATKSTGGTAYTPSTFPLVLGNYARLGQSFQNGRVVGLATFRGNPTAANLLALCDTVRLTADIPPSVPGATLTHRWSLKEVLLGQDVSVGQTAPAALLDTQTLATADTLNRVGAPKIRLTDVRRDSQVAYGLSAYANDYRVESAAGKGIRGNPSGFWVACVAQIVGTIGGYLAVCGPEPLTTGWGFYRVSGGSIWAYCGLTGAAAQLAVNATVPLNVPFILHLRWTGTAFELYADGVLQGTSGTGTYTLPASTIWMAVGNNNMNVYSTPYDTVYGVAGGDQSVTAAEILQNAEAYKRTGRLQPIANKTDHFYDFTADVVAQADVVAPPPRTVLDLTGAHHLTQTGGYVLAHGGLLNVDDPIAGSVAQTFYRAVTGAGSTNTMGAFPGAATGFTVTFLHYNTGEAVSVVAGFMTNTDIALAAGFTLFSNGQMVMQVRTTTGIVTLNMGAEPAGYVHTAVVYDGSTFKGYVNGVLAVSSVTGLVYMPSTITPVSIGSLGTSYPTINRAILGGTMGNYVLSAAEVSTASTQSRTNRKIYATPSKVDRHWSIVDDIAEAGYTVPNRLKERISGVNNLGLQMPLQLRRLQSKPGEGLRGGTTMWAAWYGVVTDLVTPNAMFFLSATGGTSLSGFIFAATGANATSVVFRVYYGNGGFDSTGTITLTQADVGVPLLFVVVRSADNSLRVYKWNSSVASGMGNSAYVPAPATHPMAIGASSSGAVALASNFYTLGVAGSDSHELTASEVAVLATYVRWAGRIQGVAGKTEHLWVNNVTHVLPANKLVPKTLKDRVGTDHLSAGLSVTQDYQLVSRGEYRGITGTHTYRSIYTRTGVGLPGSTAGFWASALVSHEQLYVYPRVVFGHWGSGAGGWQIGFSSSANTRPQATVYWAPTSGTTATGTSIFRTGDLFHVTLWYDNTTLKIFVNGALETSVACTGFQPYTPGNTCLGASDRLGVYSSFGMALYGAAGGNTLPSDAEIMTSYVESMKKNALVSIPGKTEIFYDVRQDVIERGGRIPNQLKDRAVGNSRMVLTGNYLETTAYRSKTWTYDTTPTMYGASGFTSANYLRGVFTDTCAGDPWSFFACVAFVVNSQAGAAGIRTLLASRNGIAKFGWALNTGGANANITGIIGAPTADASTGTGTIASTLVGKVQFATLMFDGTLNRLSFALNALPVGSTVQLGATEYFQPRTGVPVTLGILSDLATQSASDVTILGAAYGNGWVGAVEHRQMYYDLIANEAFPRNPKMTSVWDISAAIRTNNGAMPAYIVDEISGNSLQVVGTPTVDALYHRSFAT